MVNERHQVIRSAFLKASSDARYQRKYLPQKKWTELINKELDIAIHKECNESKVKRIFKSGDHQLMWK